MGSFDFSPALVHLDVISIMLQSIHLQVFLIFENAPSYGQLVLCVCYSETPL